jgi:hypothetical protein
MGAAGVWSSGDVELPDDQGAAAVGLHDLDLEAVTWAS